MATYQIEWGAPKLVTLGLSATQNKRYTMTLGYRTNALLNYTLVDVGLLDQVIPVYVNNLSFTGTRNAYSGRIFTATETPSIYSFSGSKVFDKAFMPRVQNALDLMLVDAGPVDLGGKRYTVAHWPAYESPTGLLATIYFHFSQAWNATVSPTVQFGKKILGGIQDFSLDFGKTDLLKVDAGVLYGQGRFNSQLWFTGVSPTRLISRALTAAESFIGAVNAAKNSIYGGAVARFTLDYGLVDKLTADGNTTFLGVLSGIARSAGRLFPEKTLSQALAGALGLASAIGATTKKTFVSSISPAADPFKRLSRALTASISPAAAFTRQAIHLYYSAFTAQLSFSGVHVATFLKWIQNQLRFRAKNNKVATRHRGAIVKVVGPQEMIFKRGTSIELEATFTDADGNVYDPDAGSVKMQIRKPDGTVYTGWNFTDNKVMVKYAVGIYRIDWQTSATDTAGNYLAEARGAVGSNVSIDDLKIPLKA